MWLKLTEIQDVSFGTEIQKSMLLLQQQWATVTFLLDAVIVLHCCADTDREEITFTDKEDNWSAVIMSAKAISEAKGKELLNKFLEGCAMQNKVATVTADVNWNQLTADNSWLLEQVAIMLMWEMPNFREILEIREDTPEIMRPVSWRQNIKI